MFHILIIPTVSFLLFCFSSWLFKSVFFPTVDAAIKNCTPVLELEQEQLDLDDLKSRVTNHPTSTEISGRQDVLAVLSALKPLTHDLNLKNMHSLVMYRNGLILLAVRLTGNDGERCAYVDMNHFRNALEVLAASAKSARNSIIQGIAFGLFVATTIYLWDY